MGTELRVGTLIILHKNISNIIKKPAEIFSSFLFLTEAKEFTKTKTIFLSRCG